MEHQERMPAQEAKALLSPECLQEWLLPSLAQEDKPWASKAWLKLARRQNGFLVSVPPFPVKGCGSSRTMSPLHPPSCLPEANAHPWGSAACAPAQPRCGAAVWPSIWLLGKSWEKPHWKTLLFPWEPPLRPSALVFAWSTKQLCLCLTTHLTDAHHGPASFLQIFLAITDQMVAAAHWHSGPGTLLHSGAAGRHRGWWDTTLPTPDYLSMGSIIELPAVASSSITPFNGGHSGEGIGKPWLFITALNQLNLGICFWCLVTRREPLCIHYGWERLVHLFFLSGKYCPL